MLRCSKHSLLTPTPLHAALQVLQVGMGLNFGGGDDSAGPANGQPGAPPSRPEPTKAPEPAAAKPKAPQPEPSQNMTEEERAAAAQKEAALKEKELGRCSAGRWLLAAAIIQAVLMAGYRGHLSNQPGASNIRAC